jgi:uncharacterized membrane protein
MTKIHTAFDNFKKNISGFSKDIRQDKRKMILSVLSLLTILLIAYIMRHNYHWYDNSIVKITEVKNTFNHKEPIDKWTSESYYDQDLVGTIMNGNHKGQTIHLTNQYASSQVYSEKYNKSDEVFVEITQEKPILTGRITKLKRDKYLVIPFSILILGSILILSKKGFFTILSLFINMGIFYWAIKMYTQGTDLLVVTRYMMILFAVISLFLISGFHLKTLAAIVSTLMTVGVMTLVIHLFVKYSTDIDYAYMDYVFSPKNLQAIFISQLLIAGLGAVMDIAIMMATLIDELLTKNPKISLSALWKSGRELGYDVMGAMINVMLFTYLCGSIPLIALKMKMDIKLSTIITYHMPMEIYRFFLGGIGIMLAIPVSLVTTLFILKKGAKKI